MVIFREKLLQPNLYLKGKFPFVGNRAAATSQHPACNILHPILMYCFPLSGASIPSPSCCPFAATGNAQGSGCSGLQSRQAARLRWTEEQKHQRKRRRNRQLGSSRLLPPEPPRKGSAPARSRGTCPALNPLRLNGKVRWVSLGAALRAMICWQFTQTLLKDRGGVSAGSQTQTTRVP